MNSVVTSILFVFTTVLEWFSTSLGSISSIFYDAESGLTLVGTLSVITVAISVSLMVIAMIRSLLKFRG